MPNAMHSLCHRTPTGIKSVRRKKQDSAAGGEGSGKTGTPPAPPAPPLHRDRAFLAAVVCGKMRALPQLEWQGELRVARRGRAHKHRKEDRRPAPGPAFRAGRSFVFFFVLGLIAAAVAARTLDADQRAAKPAPSAAKPAAKPARDLAAAEATFQEGYRQLREENLEEAHRAFSRAAELDPRDPRPHMGLGKVLEALNYRERAQEAYRRAIALDGTFSDAKIELARVLCDFGKHAESIALLNSARRDDPANALVAAELAANELRQGNAAAAIPLIEEYLARTGPTAWAYEHLGRAYADTGNAKGAEEQYRRALALKPASELGNLWLGQLLVALGRRPEAEQHFRRFRELRSYQTESREVEQAIARRPGDVGQLVRLLVRLAELRARQEKHREALVPLKRALDLIPGDEALRRLYEDQSRRAAAAAARER